jgi:DNA-binding CsgD family transcriptional regulator
MESKLIIKNSDIQIDQFIGDMGSFVLKSIRDPFGVFGIDFSIKWVNKAMAYIHQCKPEDMIGKNCYFDFCKNSLTCGQCPIISVRDTGKTFITERWLDFSDGKRRWGEVRAYPVWNNDRELLAVLILVIETTNIQKKLHEKKKYNEYLSDIINKNTGKNKKNNIYKEDIKFAVNMSKRETEILRLLTEGYTNPRISGILSISYNTVKRHVDNIFNKLGVNDRTQAAVLAIRNKLI